MFACTASCLESPLLPIHADRGAKGLPIYLNRMNPCGVIDAVTFE